MTQHLRAIRAQLRLPSPPSHWKMFITACVGVAAVGGALAYALPYINAPSRIDETANTLAVMQRNQIDWQIKRAERDARQDAFQAAVIYRLDVLDAKLSRSGIAAYPFDHFNGPGMDEVLIGGNTTSR